MARGVVKLNHGDGLYTITVNFNSDYAAIKIGKLADEAAQYTIDSAAKEIEKTAQQIVVDAALVTRDAAAQAYQTTPTDANFKALNSSQAAYLVEVEKLNAIRNAINLYTIKKQGAEKETAYINSNVPAGYDVVSWCADFTDDIPIGAEVGLISIGRVDHVGDGAQIVTEAEKPQRLVDILRAEAVELQTLREAKDQELVDFIIAHEGKIYDVVDVREINAIIDAIQLLYVRQSAVYQEILSVKDDTGFITGAVPELSTWYIIYPGKGSSSYAYDETRDGNLTPVVSMSPESSFFNTAILPGMAKWKPTYRIGTITGINKTAHTADVSLDYLTSSWQGLNVNQTPTLASVPVEYGICNSTVFNVDDRVLVGFDSYDWEQPKVLGFESEPKQCTPRYAFFKVSAVFFSAYGTGIVWDMVDNAIATLTMIDETPVANPGPIIEVQEWVDERVDGGGVDPYTYSPLDEQNVNDALTAEGKSWATLGTTTLPFTEKVLGATQSTWTFTSTPETGSIRELNAPSFIGYLDRRHTALLPDSPLPSTVNLAANSPRLMTGPTGIESRRGAAWVSSSSVVGGGSFGDETTEYEFPLGVMTFNGSFDGRNDNNTITEEVSQYIEFIGGGFALSETVALVQVSYVVGRLAESSRSRIDGGEITGTLTYRDTGQVFVGCGYLANKALETDVSLQARNLIIEGLIVTAIESLRDELPSGSFDDDEVTPTSVQISLIR